MKLEQELEFHQPLPNATSLFNHTANLSLADIEEFCKLKVKEAKKLAIKEARAQEKAIAQAKEERSIEKGKKEQKRKDAVKKKKALKRTEDWIEATKQAKNLAKREILKRLKIADKEGHTIADVIAELERQLQ